MIYHVHFNHYISHGAINGMIVIKLEAVMKQKDNYHFERLNQRQPNAKTGTPQAENEKHEKLSRNFTHHMLSGAML